MLGVSQLNKTFASWQAKGYIIQALAWFWVAAIVFSVVLSVLGISSFDDRFVRRGRELGSGENQVPVIYYYIRMIGAGIVTLSYLLASVWLVVNRAGRGMPLLAAYVLLGFIATKTDFADAYVVHDASSPEFLTFPFYVLRVMANIVFILFPLLFPNGRFVPRWTRYFAVVWVALTTLSLFFPSFPLNIMYYRSGDVPAYYYLYILVCLTIPIAAQVYRYFFVSTKLEQEQSRWVVLGLVAVLVAVLFDYGFRGSIIRFLFPLDADGNRTHIWLHRDGRLVMMTLGYSFFPFALCYALSRNRIWRVDPFVRRSVVYSALTIIVVLIYGSIVAVLSSAFEQRFSFFTALVAAGVVAVLFHPLKQRLQGAVNKLLYGQRDDPYKVLTNLGQQVRGSVDALAALKELCESTSNVLKLPFVSIWLDEAGTAPVASCGESTEDVVSFPLTHEGAALGTLQVARRSEGEPFTSNERLLLSTIAQQVSVLARNYLLTQALQVSRERLVLSREEERRRIRRDLHDGLGPTLASTAMQLETARQLIYSKPDEGAGILKSLEQKMSSTLSEVRALVHDLYPTAIDQLGLYAALQNELKAFETKTLKIQLELEGTLEALPAAVEVAVYRIVMEAVHNVQKHAQASLCSVCLTRETERLWAKVEDDGVGFEATYGQGIGLHSIRERAEELGGTATFETVKPEGSLVTVMLPIKRFDL